MISTMEYYRGRRIGTNCEVTRPDGLPLPPMRNIRNHSPCGFEWGYTGSGPAQLALALVYDWAVHYSDVPCENAEDRKRCQDFAHERYQDFKSNLVACLSLQWDLHVCTVEDWLAWKAEEHTGKQVDWSAWRRSLVCAGMLIAVPGEDRK